MKRPFAVTALLILLFLLLLIPIFSLIGVVRSLSLGHYAYAPYSDIAKLLLPSLIFLTLLFFTFWALLKRRASGRWLGSGLLALLSIVLLLSGFLPNTNSPYRVAYGNPAEGLMMERIWGFLTFALFAWWANLVAFSTKVRSYFSDAPTP